MIRHFLASGIFKAKLTMQKKRKDSDQSRLGSYFLDFLPGKERPSLLFFLEQMHMGVSKNRGFYPKLDGL